ncbi:Exopolygalacturonase X [Cladophialophora carrionii]|uniref:galacturonan 1,4-alpha-galacturonidase n=1 Tax=Cladophialophora carrionii TaxID=86049 RepID=A0A1C1CUK5_9EURO|nr:Exopolygalacturonase X [Cladophialophora carrionii]
MTFLRSIDIENQGYIQFTNGTDYWQAHSPKQVFQSATTFFKLGGEDVNVYRGGTLDGNGQMWYDLYGQDIYILRPILFGNVGVHSGTISDFKLVYSPQYYNWVANSSNVIFSHISITGFSTSNNTAKNTDGWGHVPERRDHDPELGRQQRRRLRQLSSPTSTNMLVAGHALQWARTASASAVSPSTPPRPTTYATSTPTCTTYLSMANVTDGARARIKVWPGSPSELSADTAGRRRRRRWRPPPAQCSKVTYDTFCRCTTSTTPSSITRCYRPERTHHALQRVPLRR